MSGETLNPAEEQGIENNNASHDVRLFGARALANVNFEDSHQDIVQSSFERAMKHGERIEGERPNVRRNYVYLNRLEKLIEKYGNKAEQRLCRLSATNLIVKPGDISDKFWERENRRSIERGDGELTDEVKDRKIEDIKERQRRSVEKWSTYLGDEASPFPLWFKTYVFDGISKMGRYDGENGVFLKRRRGDISSYPSLNEAALSQTYQAIITENGNEPDVEQLVKNGNFNKLYSKFYTEQNRKFEDVKLPEKPEDVRGRWVEYGLDQINELFQASSLNGCWCIGCDYGVLEGYFDTGNYTPDTRQQFDAQENLASDIGNKSKFILFHPLSPENDEALGVPLVSIRLDKNGEVAEISGVMEDECGTQILSDALVPEVERKVLSLPGGEKYKEAFEQREKLIAISSKLTDEEHITGNDIAGDDLAFLWMPDNIYHSIGRYENLGDSSKLAEAKEKTKGLFAEKVGNVARGAIVLANILEEYGLGKSAELVPQIAANGVDLVTLARYTLRPNNWLPDRVDRFDMQQIKFANALLENGLSVRDLYRTMEVEPDERFSQRTHEARLLQAKIDPESILRSLNNNGKRGSLGIMEYARDGLSLEKIVPLVDLIDPERWVFELTHMEDFPEDVDFRKMLDQSAIEQFKEEFERRGKLVGDTERAFEKFLWHLRKEFENHGFLDHIDDAVELTRDAMEANDLLECGADPDMVLNRLMDFADEYNSELDDYVRFGSLLDAFARRGEGSVMPDYVVSMFSPEFVARHADELMSKKFGASAEAIAEKLDSLTVLDRINDLHEKGASTETLARRTGEALADTINIVHNLDTIFNISPQIVIDAFNKHLKEADFTPEEKEQFKDLAQKILSSIE